MLKKYDLVLVNVPFLKLIPQTGPALIKASVERAGFSCKVVDWNFELYKDLNMEYYKYNIISLDSALRDEICSTIMTNIIKLSNDIKKYSPRWIGLSIYGRTASENIITKICISLRKNVPDSKIVAGGHAITTTDLGDVLLKKTLIDCYIYGEGEESVVSLLSSDTDIPGYNGSSYYQVSDINKLPDPDYSDTPPNKYPFKEAFLITSRGCVNNCVYCENFFKKFKYRNPKNIINEITDLYKQYGISVFTFSDSISNGNVRQLKKICLLICDNIEKGVLPRIKWRAFMGCFPKRVMNSEIYTVMKQSGCEKISVGIESGSERLRQDMNKKFSNDDLYYMIEQCCKNKIRIGVCLISGLYTENENDHKETLKFLSKIVKFQEYVDLDSFATMFLPNNKQTKFDRYIKYDKAGHWYYKENTFIVRIRRWTEIIEHCINIGFEKVPIYFKWNTFSDLQNYEQTPEVKNLIERLNFLYKIKSV